MRGHFFHLCDLSGRCNAESSAGCVPGLARIATCIASECQPCHPGRDGPPPPPVEWDYRPFLILLLTFVLCSSSWGASSQSELIFEVQTALKTRDYPGLAKCFEFNGAEPETERSVWKVLDQIVAWPTHHIKVSERRSSGPFEMERGGRKYTLNGDWTFQVHIHLRPPPSRGFVFPAGMTKDGRFAILLSVPKV